jgi:hypothetical protein
MPRTSRSVAQRLASQANKKKRRPRALLPTAAPETDQPLEDEISSEVDAQANPLPPAAPEPISGAPRRRSAAPPVERGAPSPSRFGSGARGRSSAARAPVRTAAPRRPYSEYTEEYTYVSADLRRIALVAVVLIALLVVLSFVVQ